MVVGQADSKGFGFKLIFFFLWLVVLGVGSARGFAHP